MISAEWHYHKCSRSLREASVTVSQEVFLEEVVSEAGREESSVINRVKIGKE